MNASQSCYIRSRGKILGPFSVEQLQQLRDRGQLRRFHEVSTDRQNWATASSFTELFPPEAPSRAAIASRDAEAPSVAMPSASGAGYAVGGGESDSVKDGWRCVRTGLGLLLLSNYIWLGGHLFFLVGMLLMWAAGASAFANVRHLDDEFGVMESLGMSILFLAVLWILSQLAAIILQLVGHGFCMAVAPRRNSGVKPLAITVFVLAVVALVLSILTRMAGLVAASHRELGAVALYGGPFHLPVYVLDLVTFCLLLFFLRSVALALGKKELAGNVMILLASWGGYLATAVVLFFFLLLALFDRHLPFERRFRLVGPFAVFIVAILGCIGLALYVWFLIILHQTRRAVGRHLSDR